MNDMNWQELAATSHYRTAVAVADQLSAGRVGEARDGIEELIEALSRSDRRALKSQLIRLMAHILKWECQPDLRSRSWVATIDNARAEIADIQEETPSLSAEVIKQMWDRCLASARREAEAAIDQPIPRATLSWEEVFDVAYCAE